jgi:hypothetical protein
MSDFTIVTSRGQFVLPECFRRGVANGGDKRLSLYYDPQIFGLAFGQTAIPSVAYNNWWWCIFVLYDRVGERYRQAFVTEAPLAVHGNPLPVAISRAMAELPDGETALVYGALRGQNRDHGPVLNWVPKPAVDEPNQLLLVIQ